MPVTLDASRATQYVVVCDPVFTTRAACEAPDASAAHAGADPATAGAKAGRARIRPNVSVRRRRMAQQATVAGAGPVTGPLSGNGVRNSPGIAPIVAPTSGSPFTSPSHV